MYHARVEMKEEASARARNTICQRQKGRMSLMLKTWRISPPGAAEGPSVPPTSPLFLARFWGVLTLPGGGGQHLNGLLPLPFPGLRHGGQDNARWQLPLFFVGRHEAGLELCLQRPAQDLDAADWDCTLLITLLLLLSQNWKLTCSLLHTDMSFFPFSFYQPITGNACVCVCVCMRVHACVHARAHAHVMKWAYILMPSKALRALIRQAP